MEITEAVEHWALVELFGHQKIAGRVSEYTFGGCSFVRVDVLETEYTQGFTKHYTQGAIYGLTFVDEETCMAAIKHFAVEPIDEWSARRMLASAPASQPYPLHLSEDEDEY